MKTSIFIDGNTVFCNFRDAGIVGDYSKLVKLLLGNDELVKAHFFCGAVQSEQQKGFLHWMRRNGFQVTCYEGASAKNLVDIAMSVEMAMSKVDKVVIVSGSNSFTYPATKLSVLGVRIVVAGVEKDIANNLLNVVDEVIFLNEHWEELRMEE